jgi:hypothetical protein
MKIKLTSVYVDDQAKALGFYTEVATGMEHANGALLRTRETVVGEKPLSFAISRIVVTEFLTIE